MIGSPPGTAGLTGSVTVSTVRSLSKRSLDLEEACLLERAGDTWDNNGPMSEIKVTSFHFNFTYPLRGQTAAFVQRRPPATLPPFRPILRPVFICDFCAILVALLSRSNCSFKSRVLVAGDFSRAIYRHNITGVSNIFEVWCKFARLFKLKACVSAAKISKYAVSVYTELAMLVSPFWILKIKNYNNSQISREL